MENDKPNINILEHADQDNDLVNFLKNFRIYWDRYGQQVLWIILISLLIVAGLRWWTYRQAAAHEDAWSGLATATSPEAYQALARTTGDDSVRALALIRGADLLLREAVSPRDPALETAVDAAVEGGIGPDGSAIEAPGLPSPVTPEAVDPQAALTSAAGMYQQVLSIPNVHRLFQINALAGLANVAESQGEWDKARESWQQVADIAGKDYSMTALQARSRLAALDELSQPVRFGAEQPQSDASGLPGELVPGMGPGGQFEFNPEMGATDLPAPLPPAEGATTPPAPAPTDDDVPPSEPDMPALLENIESNKPAVPRVKPADKPAAPAEEIHIDLEEPEDDPEAAGDEYENPEAGG